MPNNPRASNPLCSPIASDGQQRISGSCSEYESVNVLTGNFMCQITVMSIPTVGAPLNFYLTYNHQDPVLQTVGNGWRHNYMMSLDIDLSDNLVTFISDSGSQFYYSETDDVWALNGVGSSASTVSNFFAGTLSSNMARTLWYITMPNTSTLTFDASGRLQALTDRHGNVSALGYDGSGNLITVTESITSRPRQIQLAYTEDMLSSITDPKGNVTSLFFASSNLTQVVGPSGCVMSFGYDDSNRVTTRTDARGGTYTFTYDDSFTPSRLQTVTDAETPANSISYACMIYESSFTVTGDVEG